MYSGLSLTSSSLNDAVRGAVASANRDSCRGAGVVGPWGALGVKYRKKRFPAFAVRRMKETDFRESTSVW